MQNKEALIEKFLARTISEKERKTLKKWVLRKKENLDFFKTEIRNRSNGALYHHFDENEAFTRFLATVEKKKTKRIIPTQVLKYAAMFIGAAAVGFWTYQSLNTSKTNDVLVQQENTDNGQRNDIVISLADGTKQIISSDDATELLDKNGNTIATKQANGLDFSSVDGNTTQNLVFNEIYVPYGQTFSITLSDGTKVWLNAGTRLRFPQNLNSASQNRMVYLDGEAFFDVAHNKERPFIVNAQNVDVKVLGTKFNVSAYKSESKIATTLVEGSVNVYENSNPDTKMILEPNYQAAFVKENGTLSKVKVDTRIYTSWMENKLIIDHLSFGEIMDKLERRHNVSIVDQTKNLSDEMYRGEFENETIETILATIAQSTPFNFNREGNVITISE